MINKNKDYFYFLTKTGYGLGSEINNILYLIYYFNKKKRNFRIISSNWNAGYNKGWKDYFSSSLQSKTSTSTWTEKEEGFWNVFFETPIEKSDKLPSFKFKLAKASIQFKKTNKN